MKHLYIYLCTIIAFASCGNTAIESYTEADKFATIYPEYEGTYIPYNIAPLNFQVREDASEYIIRVVAEKDSFEVSTKRDSNIPIKKWKTLLEKNKGKSLEIKIFAEKDDNWTKYRTLNFKIANEPIDSHVAYRLIEPGYAAWGTMGLYQRSLESFEEIPILLNSQTDGNCMNCHSFRQNDPNLMLFHMRGENAGTMIVKDNTAKKINTKTPWMTSAGVYPRWHPNGKYVAFSTNQTSQGFLTAHTNKIEVFDMQSDIVLYDTQSNTMTTSNVLFSNASYETFPEWSPDGKYLYFCSAPALQMPQSYESIKYDLLRVGFDEQSGRFSPVVDTLVSSKDTGKSLSMPRVSPDGTKLVFCMFDYGTFPIWHRENDLYILDLLTGEYRNMTEINSDQTDSYHSWSSNGRWMIFSSRRMDGNYTRLYISYIDAEGNGSKPFLLPQETPLYYDYLMKSYNIPELITGKIQISSTQLSAAAKMEAISVDSK